LTFDPGVTIRTFVIRVRPDTQAEGPETVLIELSNPAGGADLGALRTAVLTITDNDVAGKVQFGAPAYTVNEAGPFATIVVRRGGGAAGDVSVRYATADGTAKEGTDYTAASGTLSFGPGVLSRSFSVPILDDGMIGANKTVNLLLSDPAGGALLGAPASAVL